jgi:hypothetical protein
VGADKEKDIVLDRNEEPAMISVIPLPLPLPTPTLAPFRSARLPCPCCENIDMRIILLEPKSSRVDLVLYRCDGCARSESFLLPLHR